jgi:hypothetical protein
VKEVYFLYVEYVEMGRSVLGWGDEVPG